MPERSPFHREHRMSAATPLGRRHAPGPRALTDTARALAAVRVIADQAFSRAAGAPLVHGNAVRILKDGAENYPAWLSAIGAARATTGSPWWWTAASRSSPACAWARPGRAGPSAASRAGATPAWRSAGRRWP